jgi:hypothetical protein
MLLSRVPERVALAVWMREGIEDADAGRSIDAKTAIAPFALPAVNVELSNRAGPAMPPAAVWSPGDSAHEPS